MKKPEFDYKDICLKMCELGKQTGSYILRQRDEIEMEQVEVKGEHNYVTYVDKTAEKMLVDGLRVLMPDAGFITEEDTDSTVGEVFNWIIDPLDGTTNFIHGVPVFCVSIALKEHDDIVAGVIYEVNRKECFYAWKDGDAMLNDRIIRVSANNDFNTALLATGFPYYDYGKLDEYMEVFNKMMKQTAGLRRLGSAAADMAYVAAGRFEGFYEYGLHPWDVAAGIIIVQRAGGIVTDFKGGNNALFGKEMICANNTVHEKMLEIIRMHFK